jgi:methylenetetrahydrofolate reductase (NADPH)
MSLREKIESGGFVFTAELGPPRSASDKSIKRKCGYYRGLVDAANITDNQTAIVRLSSIATGRICLEQGVEPVIQMTCRDRNRLALQSDLLGMAALGMENVLCLTGDHQRFGDQPEARNVFDLDSIQLIATADRLRKGVFLSGDKVKTPPRLFVGGAANPFAEPLIARITRLGKKISAGVDFIQTQPVYDVEAFLRWMDAVRGEGLDTKTAILAGVMPVKSPRALIHMRDEVPGSRIPADLIGRMEQASEPEEEGVRIAVEIIRRLLDVEGIGGIHLMPLMWEKITPRIAEESGLAERSGNTGEAPS